LIRCGAKGTVYKVSYVKHELRQDQDVTLFSIKECIHNRDGSVAKIKAKDGQLVDKNIFMQVTAWEDLPLTDGQEVRLQFITDLKVWEMKNKNGYMQTYYSITAKVVIVS